MTVPELVRERLADEEVTERVPLGGDDELVVTPSRTLIYRAEGLLSGESIEEHAHDAERISVSDGRRKTTIALDHGIDGESEFTIPSKRADDALPPVLGGVLRAAGVTGPDEAVEEVYRLGELTIAITDARVIKYIGPDLWDEEYEEYAFEDVTGLDVEAGDVSSQIILEVDGRPQRIKTPSEDAREVRERIERALLSYHDVGSYREFIEQVAPAADAEEGSTAEADAGRDEEATGEDATPEGAEADADPDIGAGLTFEEADPIDVEATAGASGGEAEIAEEVEALREAVERQNELLQNQRRTIEKLIEELRRGR